MADNTTLDPGAAGDAIVTREISHGGDTAKLPGSFLMGISGTEGSYTAGAVGGDATNGLDVDVTRVIPGTSATHLGKAIDTAGGATDTGVAILAIRDDALTTLTPVDGDYVALRVGSTGALHVTGTAAVTGTVDLGATDNAVLDAIAASLALLDNSISAGNELQVDIVGAIPAGTNNIGDVDVLTIAAGDNNIGNVDIVSLPASTNTLEVVGDAAENAAAAGNPVLVGGRYDSSARTLGNADVGAIALNASGQVLVEIAAGAGSGGTAAADDADFTDGTTSFNPIGGVYESTPTQVTDGDMGMAGITVDRELKVSVTSGGVVGVVENAVASGSAEGILAIAVRDDSLSTLTPADGDYTCLRVSSTGALHVTGGGGGTEYTVDAAAPAAPTGATFVMERDDSLSSLTEVEGDWTNPRSNANGAMWVAVNGTATVSGTVDLGATDNAVLDAIAASLALIDNSIATGNELQVDVVGALPAGTNNIGDVDVLTIAAGDNNIGNVDIVTMPNVTLAAGTNTNEVVGDVAHDAAASGNPVQTGGYATNNIEAITQVAAADLTRTVHDLNGVQVVRPHTTLEEIQMVRTTNTDGASTSLISAAGSGVHNYVTHVTIWNSSATDGFIDFRDGTAGSVLHTFPAPQTGGCTVAFNPPMKFGDNTAVAFDPSGAITTLYISAVYFQAQG